MSAQFCNVKIREVRNSDLKHILKIENQTQVAPWSFEIFQMCMHVGYRLWVCENQAEVIGFIIVSNQLDECHVLNLGVAKGSQRQGYGRSLLRHALDFAKNHGATTAYLEVRESNAAAIALYQKSGFCITGRRKDYYPIGDGREDALIMDAELAALLVEDMDDSLLKSC